MTTSDQIDLSTYDPMDREVQQCPFNHYAALRDHGPLFFHEQSNMFFASRLDVVNEIPVSYTHLTLPTICSV